MSGIVGHCGLFLLPSGSVPGVPMRSFRVTVSLWTSGNTVPGAGLVRFTNFRVLDESAGVHPSANMTSATAPSPLVASASSYYPGEDPWKAFDGTLSNSSRWMSAEFDSSPQWLEIDLGAGNEISPSAFLLAADENVSTPSYNYPIDFVIEGSNSPGVYAGEQVLYVTRSGFSFGNWLPAANNQTIVVD